MLKKNLGQGQTDKSHKIIGLGLTFDDVLIVPAHSNVLPKETNIKTQLAPNIVLNIPLIAAAMDTVTESQMAAAMARNGGLGIIHKACDIVYQAEQVQIVKRSQSWMISRPYTLDPNDTLDDVRKLIREKNVSSVLIVTSDGALVGILTNRDIKLVPENENPKISERMTPKNKLITGKSDTTIQQAKELLDKHRVEKLPLVDENGKLVGLITAKDLINPIKYPLAVTDSQGRLLVGAAIGVSQDLMERAQTLIEAGADLLCLDSAHGHAQGVLDAVKKIKDRYPETPLMAGNISTKSGALALIEAGANIIKVGQGAGSICTTRVVAGCGMPQLTAILEVAEAVKKHNEDHHQQITIVADGGIKYSGDIAKAIAAGGHAVMLGSLLAGTTEAPSEDITYQGQRYKSYRGMGSKAVMEKTGGDRYFQNTAMAKAVPEGIEGAVPLKGSVDEILYQLCGGLRSAMGYSGARDLLCLQDAKFIQITAAGQAENHPHNVVIIKEAPNYSIR